LKMAKKKEQEKGIECRDEKCPVHGTISVRRKHFKGTVKKIIGKRAVIEFERFIYSKKYERYSKSKTRFHVYVPECLKNIAIGDLVEVRECKPINKIIHFIMVKRIK